MEIDVNYNGKNLNNIQQKGFEIFFIRSNEATVVIGITLAIIVGQVLNTAMRMFNRPTGGPTQETP